MSFYHFYKTKPTEIKIKIKKKRVRHKIELAALHNVTKLNLQKKNCHSKICDECIRINLFAALLPLVTFGAKMVMLLCDAIRHVG